MDPPACTIETAFLSDFFRLYKIMGAWQFELMIEQNLNDSDICCILLAYCGKGLNSHKNLGPPTARKYVSENEGQELEILNN